MQQLISPFIPFPNIYWWASVLQQNDILLDKAEYYQKMTHRNRYYITGGNGLILLSVPLVKGRNQRTPMADVLIDNSNAWQQQHWRSIYSVYGNAPYFEHYAPELKNLFEVEYSNLINYCESTILLMSKLAGIQVNIQYANDYQNEYEDATDLRNNMKPGIERKQIESQLYYQMFAERNGFYPNLSILDILLTEGPATKGILLSNKKEIEAWGNK